MRSYVTLYWPLIVAIVITAFLILLAPNLLFFDTCACSTLREA
jgi:hypothetical protein